MQDCRDLLAWVRDEHGFAKALGPKLATDYLLDQDHVFAMGTSSGGTLALSLVSALCPQMSYTVRSLALIVF